MESDAWLLPYVANPFLLDLAIHVGPENSGRVSYDG